MKELELKTYTQKELAEWFGITYNTFRMLKDKKLEELREYAEYNIINSKNGRLKGIQITSIYCPIYYKSNKDDFVSFLLNPENWKCTLDSRYGNISIIVNYYCELNNIPYKDVGLRSYYIKAEGMSFDGKHKLSEVKLIRNTEDYKLWYYLYDVAKNFFNEHKWIDSEDKVLCRTDSYHPISLKVSTEEAKEKAKVIWKKYNSTYDTNCIEELKKEGLLPREGFKMRAPGL